MDCVRPLSFSSFFQQKLFCYVAMRTDRFFFCFSFVPRLNAYIYIYIYQFKKKNKNREQIEVRKQKDLRSLWPCYPAASMTSIYCYFCFTFLFSCFFFQFFFLALVREELFFFFLCSSAPAEHRFCFGALSRCFGGREEDNLLDPASWPSRLPLLVSFSSLKPMRNLSANDMHLKKKRANSQTRESRAKKMQQLRK